MNQFALALSDRPTDEILRERLGVAVAEFNAAEGDPPRRCDLMAEIKRLRGLLGEKAPQ